MNNEFSVTDLCLSCETHYYCNNCAYGSRCGYNDKGESIVVTCSNYKKRVIVDECPIVLPTENNHNLVLDKLKAIGISYMIVNRTYTRDNFWVEVFNGNSWSVIIWNGTNYEWKY